MTRNTEYGIAVQKVTKVYHPITLATFLGKKPKGAGYLAVDNVSFNIGRGDIFGLVGPNGAGKTTLIKIICALLYPTSGSVLIEGFDTVSDEGAVKRKIGLVTSNERSFYWRLTGRQNLEFFASLYSLDASQSTRWIDQLLDFLRLTEYADQRFDGFSTGTKQRFAIARGMLSKPNILLLDEPTKGVDPINAAEIIRLLREDLANIWRPTMVITSHNLREIELLCSRVGIMHRSRMLAQGTLEELAAIAHPNSRQRIRFNGRVEDIGLLPALPDTQDIKLKDTGDGAQELSFFSPDGSGAVSVALRFLIDRGATIRAVDRHRQTLDDVFSNLVERSR